MRKRESASGLTIRQEKAALELAGGMKQADVAKYVGVSEKTIKNWKHIPEFIARIREKKNELVNEYEDEWMDTMISRAREVIETNLENKNPWIAMRAAEKVLDMAAKRKTEADNTVQVVFSSAPPPALPKSSETIVGTID